MTLFKFNLNLIMKDDTISKLAKNNFHKNCPSAFIRSYLGNRASILGVRKPGPGPLRTPQKFGKFIFTQN